MKYTIRTVLVLLAALTTPVFISCSPDRVEEEVAEEETLLTAETPMLELKPLWDDGTITITTGNFATGESIVRAFERRRSTHLGRQWLKKMLKEGVVPIEQGKRTIEIVVMTLLEAGFDEPATIAEIRRRFREIGYRPLTIQEAMELRLQFDDQPSTKTGHKMSAFFVLLSEEETRLIQIDEEDISIALVKNEYGYDHDRYIIGLYMHPKEIDPHSPEITFDKNGFRVSRNTGTRFAGVTIK